MEDEAAPRSSAVAATVFYYAAFVAMGVGAACLGPTLSGLAANTGSTLGAIGVLFSARSLGSLLGSVLGGRLYDRFSAHRILAGVILVMAFLTALVPIIPELWLLTLLMFVAGVAQGIVNVGGNALLVWVHGRKVGPYMNGLHFFFGLGTFITPLIVAQFVSHRGGLLWTYLVLALIMVPTASVVFVRSPASPSPLRGGVREKLDPALIALIAAVLGIYSGASLAFGGWVFTYATTTGIADATNSAYLNSVFWGTLSIGRLVAIPLAVRYRPRALLTADFAGGFLSLLILVLFPRSGVALIVASAGFGFALASIYPTAISLAGPVMKMSGRVTGLFSLGSSAGSMVLPWIVGLFFEAFGPDSMSFILLVDMAAGLLTLFIIRRLIARRGAHDADFGARADVAAPPT